MKTAAAQIAIVAALTALAGCRCEDAPRNGPPTEMRKQGPSAVSTTKSAPRADRGPTTSGRPHEKDSDLLEHMQ